MASIRDLFVTLGFDIDEKPLQKIDRNIKNVTTSAKRLSLVFLGASAAIGVFLKQAGDFEQVEIAFETMLGSADKAKELLDGLKEDARRTPFTLPGILNNAKLLLAMGIEAENVRDTITTLGNIAAGVGREKLPQLALALGQVRAATKLRGQELRQFTEAGVPLLDELSKILGKPVKEMQDLVSKGEVSFEMVNQALVNLTTGSGRFANLMEKQSTTFLGILSNLQDFIIINAIAIGKELLPQAKAIANELLRFLEINRKIIRARFVKFFKGLANIMGILFRAFKAVIEGVMTLSEALGGLENVIMGVVLGMLAFTSLQILSGIGSITQAIFGLATRFKALGVAATLAQAKIFIIPILIGAAVVALGLIIEDIVGFFQGKDSLTGVLIEAFERKFPDAFINTKAALLAIRDTITLIIDEAKLLIGFLTELIVFEKLERLAKVREFISGLSLEKAARAIGFGEEITPVGGATQSNQVRVNAPVTVNVPEGTPAEVITPAIQTGMREAFDTILRETSRATAPQVAQ